MIAVVSKNERLAAFLVSLLTEQGFSLCSRREALLTVLDLDTEQPSKEDRALVTVSENIFTQCDLVRPFLQKEFLALCRQKLGMEGNFSAECQPEVAFHTKTKEKATVRCELLPDREAVLMRGETIVLTPAEWRLFVLLYRHRGEVVSTEDCQAACRLKGRNGKEEGNSAAVTVAALRKKLDHRFGVRLILSHRSRGYSFQG